MGLPTTWALLSLLHNFWWTLSIRRVARRRKVPFASAFKLNRFATCGDDGFFIGWMDVVAEFNDITRRCGAEFSEGKHFVSSQGKLRGVFIERLYDVTLDKRGYVSAVTRKCVLPIRSLIAPEALSLVGDRILKVPKTLVLVSSLSQLCQQGPGFSRLVNRFLAKRPIIRATMRSMGLRDGFTLSEGGSGLPTQGHAVQAETLEKMHKFKKETGHRFDSMLKRTIDPIWDLAAELVEGDVDGAGTVVPIDFPKEDFEDRVDLDDFKLRCTASQYYSLIIGMGPSDHRVVRGVKWANVSKLAAKWWQAFDNFSPRLQEVTFSVVHVRSPRKGTLLPTRWCQTNMSTEAAVRSQILQSCQI